MRSVDIGILRASEIKFDLIGDFGSNIAISSAKNAVSIENGKLFYNGTYCNELVFSPCNNEAAFTLHNVVIGVNFHWQRKESQTFKGKLRFIVEDGEVRAINRIDVEEYLVSVISSEMSANSSLEFLKAHAIVSRSWLYAQLLRKNRVKQGVFGWENEDEIVRWYAREDYTLFDLCADDHCQRYQGMKTEEVNDEWVTDDDYELKYKKVGIKNIWETNKLKIILQWLTELQKIVQLAVLA